jgi:mRNA interferase MazF
MIGYRRGDVVLVNLVYSDESGVKRRPALIVSSAPYHQARQDVIVAAITSNVGRHLYGDYRIGDWRAAGLLYPSIVTGTIRTIKRSMLQRRLGTLTALDLQAFETELRRSLGL